MEKPPRSALYLSYAVFGLLLFLSLYYYLERIGNLDMAFQTFLMLKSGHVEVQSGRFGAVATQVWPWAAQVLGLSLRWVMLLYSLGHAVWPALSGFFSWRMGQWRWTLAIGLTATLMTTHTFFWLSEMPQGLVFLGAVFAWMHAKGSLRAFSWWQWPLWLGALVTAFYFHPLVLYAASFLSLFFLLEKGKNAAWRWMHLSVLAIFGVLTYLKYKVFKLDWYDAVAIKRQEAFGKLWPHWLDIKSNWKFLEWSMHDYWLLWLVWGAGLAFYLSYKRWGRAALSAFWAPAFVLLVNVPFYEAPGEQFYMENLYLPLAVFASAPLVFDMLFRENTWSYLSRYSAVVLAMLFTINGLRIANAGRFWTMRKDWEQGFLDKTASMPLRKILLTEKEAPMDTLKMSWGSPYEFLLLSALKSPDSARCLIISDSPDRFDTLLQRPRLFLGTFKNYPYEQFPVHYFHLQDTTPYRRGVGVK